MTGSDRKRSTSISIGMLVAGAAAVGVGAYALMPGRDCTPGSEEAALHAPTNPGEAPKACAPRGSSGSSGSGGSWSGHSFWGGGSSDGPSSGTSSSHGSSTSAPVSAVSRGGFGAIGHAFSSFGG